MGWPAVCQEKDGWGARRARPSNDEAEVSTYKSRNRARHLFKPTREKKCGVRILARRAVASSRGVGSELAMAALRSSVVVAARDEQAFFCRVAHQWPRRNRREASIVAPESTARTSRREREVTRDGSVRGRAPARARWAINWQVVAGPTLDQ